MPNVKNRATVSEVIAWMLSFLVMVILLMLIPYRIGTLHERDWWLSNNGSMFYVNSLNISYPHLSELNQGDQKIEQVYLDCAENVEISK